MQGSGSGKERTERERGRERERERERERDVVCLVWCFEMTLRRRCVLRDERCAGNWKTE